MSSEIDHPRQRTVAELLAEHGGGDVGTGRRRRRREAELEASDDATAGAGADPPWAPDRSVLREQVPHESDGHAPPPRPAPFRPVPDTVGGVDRGAPGTDGGPRRNGAPPAAGPDRRDAPRWNGAPDDDVFGGAPNGSAAETGAFGPPNGPAAPWSGNPGGSGGFRRVGDPNGTGMSGGEQDGHRNGVVPAEPDGPGRSRRNGEAGGTGAFRMDPRRDGGRRRRAAEPDASLFDPPGRPEPPPVSGPQTQVVAPVGPERATEQMPRMRRDGTAMIDPLLTAPIVQQDDGSPTSVGPAPGRRRREIDDGPATELSSLPDLEDGHPAGLDVDGMRSPSPRRTERPAPSSGQAWAAVVAQWIVGAVGGAALWVGFRFLWQFLPVVAIAAAALVTVGLVLVVRHLLRNDDRRTTLFAVLVGLLLTVSPALLVLLHRT